MLENGDTCTEVLEIRKRVSSQRLKTDGRSKDMVSRGNLVFE